MMKILLMLSLTWTACSVSSVRYPTTEAAAEKMMLELKQGRNGRDSNAIAAMLQAEHDKLKKAGYIFLGWRGISPTKHKIFPDNTIPPVNVDDYLQHNNPKVTNNDKNFLEKFYNGKTWSGLYLASFVDVCYG